MTDDKADLNYLNYQVKHGVSLRDALSNLGYVKHVWHRCDEPIWSEDCSYRVKPEGLRKQTFRPFKDCDELVEFWTKNYQTVLRPANTKPLIWVRLKCDGRERLIVAFGKGFGTDFVEIGNKAKAVPLQKLFDDYEFLDGKPCGVKE